jgi:acyl dehydratase
VDRVMTDWAGPRGFVARRKLSMKGAIYPGDRLRGEATVTRCYVDEQGRHRVDCDIVLSNQDYVCSVASGSIVLPAHADV